MTSPTIISSSCKKSEVGVIPCEWDVQRFDEIALIERGKFTARPRNDPKYYGGDIPFIQTGDISNSNGWIRTYSQTLNEQGLRVSKSFSAGTLFFTIAANIGDVAISTFDSACPDSLVAIKPRKHVSKFWLKQELCRRKSDFESIATHNAQLNINLEKLRPFLLPLPPLHEQEAIAEALGDADAWIESLEQLVVKKRHLKQAAMQQLLTGKTRLPGFEAEWQQKYIGEFTDCTAGGTPSTHVSEYWGGRIRWMSSGELNLRTVHEVEGRITEEGLRNSSARMLPANCVLIGLAGQGKTRGTVAVNTVSLCTNQSIAAIFPNDQFSFRYLYYNLDSRYHELRELSTGDGGRGGLNLTIIRKIALPFPCVDEQLAIADVLSGMDTEITILEAKLVKARQIKQGMMQELLTARTRLV